MRYYNCADNVLVRNIVARLEAKRHTAVDRHSARDRQCMDLLNESRPHAEPMKESIASVSIQQWINESCCANVAMNKCSLCRTKMMNSLERDVCVATSERFDSSVCKDTDIFTMPVAKCGQQMYNYNRRYVPTMRAQEPKLQR